MTLEKQEQPKNGPMSSAPMLYTGDGLVAWDTMWADFCELAMDGGPPHRGTMLEPVSASEVHSNPEQYRNVCREIARGMNLVTGMQTIANARPGWVGLVCNSEAMAAWMEKAIFMENVTVRRNGATLYLPASSKYRLEYEIKNVITAVAKTHHYWTDHRTE